MKRSLKTVLAMLLALMFVFSSTALANYPYAIVSPEPTFEAGGNDVYRAITLPDGNALNYTINNLTGLMRIKYPTPSTGYVNDNPVALYEAEAVLTLNAQDGESINIGRPDGRRVNFDEPGKFLVNGYFTNAAGNNLIGENRNLDNVGAVRDDNAIPTDANVYFLIGSSVETVGYGKVLINGTTIENQGRYYARQRSNIQLVAVPEEGYAFKEWQFLCPDSMPSNVKLNKNYLNYRYINRNLVVKAVFEPLEKAPVVPVNPDTYFKVTYKYRNLNGVWQSKRESVLAGEDATNPADITIQAEVKINGKKYEFKGWDKPDDYKNVTENRTITALYDEKVIPPPTPVPAATPTPVAPAATPTPEKVIVPFDPTTVDKNTVPKPVYVNPIRFVDPCTGLDIWALQLCKGGNPKELKVVDEADQCVCVSYKITDTSIAKMVGKKVKGIKAGVTTLVATAADGRRAVIRLYVDTPIPGGAFGVSIDDYSATGLKLSLSSKTIKKGARHNLNTVITPAYADPCYVVYTSSNPNVAKVTQTGLTTAAVQGMKKGKATVYATWMSGDGELVIVKKCKYTVK